MTDISGHVKVFKQQCTVMNRRISSTWLTVHPINVTMAYLQDETQPPILRNTVNICCFSPPDDLNQSHKCNSNKGLHDRMYKTLHENRSLSNHTVHWD